VNYLNPKRNLNDAFARGEKFFRELTPDDKVALIYHMDMDGVCSAALIRRGLKVLSEKLGGEIKISKSIVSTYKKLEGILETVGDFDKIIIVDIGVDKGIETGKDTLWIDHHLIKSDLNSESLVFINPRFENEEIYQPASYVVYKLLSRIVDLKPYGWVAAIGIVSDWGYADCRDVLDDWVKVKNKDELYQTDIGQTGELLLGASYIMGIDRILEFLTDAVSREDIINNQEIVNAYKEYDGVFKDGKKQFWENAETFGNVVISFIEPKIRRLSSPIINRVSFENPDKIVFLIESVGDEYKISARYQHANVDKKIHLGELMERCAGGGGHRAAAGGSVKPENIERFKKCVLDELR
jgi:single-stranded DNA-specific DHH superfamily exonuclease